MLKFILRGTALVISLLLIVSMVACTSTAPIARSGKMPKLEAVIHDGQTTYLYR